MATIQWGDAAEWFGAVAAALAFGTTSWAIWSAHRLRLHEHDESMFDEALKVTVLAGQGTEYVTVETPERGKERLPHTRVAVTVSNLSRREITDIAADVTTLAGVPLGTGATPFIQAGGTATFMFEATPDVWAPFGSNPMIRAWATLEFEDINKTRWRRTPQDDRLVRLHRSRRRRALAGATPATVEVASVEP